MPDNPVTPPVVGLVIAIIILTIFVWRWAVRTPVPVAPDVETEDAGKQEQEEQQVQKPFIYAAIGASDVVGVGAKDPSSESWVVLLARNLPANTQLIRLGRNGITLNEANKIEVPQAVAAKPDLITIWNCVNDATRGIPLALYMRDLRSALDRLTQDTDAHIVLLNLPDLSLLLPGPDSSRRELIRGGIRQWNAAMSQAAAEYGDRVTLVDLFPGSAQVLAQPDLVSADSFHPSSAGYRWLADHVWSVMQRENLPGAVA
ncbi:MAG: GDSL-type esterase/lipase family protein [Chloroflexota bacterium]|nr:GDSL-type esterase/lipase family protein [Chloroflexota bacterium]MDQ5864305.1 GDSL-type esterase/lipase family protein [Chloroflexota bacterium]